MKLLQSRKVIYEGESLVLISYHGLRFRLCDQQFDSEELLRSLSNGFVQLKAQLSKFDFFQIAIASGFQPKENPTSRNRHNFPPGDQTEAYYSVDGLSVFYEFRHNLLCLFSYGEVLQGMHQFTCEGIWERYPIIAVSLFKDISGDLDDFHLKALLNQQDFNQPVFEAVRDILQPHQQEQFKTFNNAPAARQYRKQRHASVPYVDFHHLPDQLDDETIRNIICYEQDAPLHYILTDLLSEEHKGQVARFQWKLHNEAKAARHAAMTDEEKRAEPEPKDKAAQEPRRFQGNMGEPDTVSGYILMYGVDPRTGRTPDDMTPQELHDKLLAKGCNRFYIEGIGGPQDSDVDVLGFSDNFWQVCYSERGRKSPSIFMTADKDRAIRFYYDHILAMEHRHLVLATRSAEALEAVRDRLESAGIKTIQGDLPDYAAQGDLVRRLFVANGDIFAVKRMLVAVPLDDTGIFSNSPKTELPEPDGNP